MSLLMEAYAAFEEDLGKPKMQRLCITEGSAQYKKMLSIILAIQDLHEHLDLYLDSLYMTNLMPHLPGAHVYLDANPMSPLMIILCGLLEG